MKRIVWSLAIVCLSVVSGFAKNGASIQLKLSGAGAVNDSTIKAGQPISVDIYVANDTVREGFSFGFAIKSETIKKIVHPSVDSGKAMGKRGDIKGFNGWQDKTVWDFGGVYVVEKDWDGALPELIGFGGIAVKQGLQAAPEPTKVLSIDLIVPEAGQLVIDSSFFPPGGEWVFTPPATLRPAWGGPYKFNVVK